MHSAPRPAGIDRWVNLLQARLDLDAVLQAGFEHMFDQRGWLKDILDYPLGSAGCQPRDGLSKSPPARKPVWFKETDPTRLIAVPVWVRYSIGELRPLRGHNRPHLYRTRVVAAITQL